MSLLDRSSSALEVLLLAANNHSAFCKLPLARRSVVSLGTLSSGDEKRHALEICVKFFERYPASLGHEGPEEQRIGETADCESEIKLPAYMIESNRRDLRNHDYQTMGFQHQCNPKKRKHSQFEIHAADEVTAVAFARVALLNISTGIAQDRGPMQAENMRLN
jgi:hypothetical protein